MKSKNLFIISLFIMLIAYSICVRLMEKNNLLLPENDIKKTVDSIKSEKSNQANRLTSVIKNTIKTKEPQGKLKIFKLNYNNYQS